MNGRHVTRPSRIDAAGRRGVDGDDRLVADGARLVRPGGLVPPHRRLARRLQAAGLIGAVAADVAVDDDGVEVAVTPDVDHVAGAAGPDAATTIVVLERRDARSATGRRLDQLDELVRGVVAELALELRRRLPAQATELVVLPAGVAAGAGAGDRAHRRART